MILKKESAGGYYTTTADTNNASNILSLRGSFVAQLTHLAAMPAAFLQGLS